MADRETVKLFDRVRITDNSLGFNGYEGVVAYIGRDGVSVALVGVDFDDYLPLRWNEFEVIRVVDVTSP